MSARPWPRRLQRAGLQRNSPTVRFVILGLLDVSAWLVGWQLAMLVIGTIVPAVATAELLLITAVSQLVLGAALSLYRNRFPIGSSSELGMIAAATTGVFAIALVVIFTLGEPVPAAAAVLAGVFAVVLMVASRQLLRTFLDRARRPRSGARVVLVGAGDIGHGLIRHMQADPDGDYLPVGLVDDDRAKRFLKLSGIRVLGTTAAIRRVTDETQADGVIVAIRAADAQLFRTLTAQLEGTAVWIRTVPTLADQLHQDIDVTQLRDINVEDLIGRDVAPIDLRSATQLIAGARVLVTGAGGSIGAELCRQIHRLNPAALIMLDRDESALHALSMSIHGVALMDTPDLVLADVRDPEALRRIFAHHRPQLVFHAAALKHLPMLERFPAEGWKTNVHGTLNVLRAAHEAGAHRFVNISTDKSANPSSELGRSKLLAEALTASFAELTGKPYVSVRFGNVFGSRGSVLVSFAEQIKRGGPVTITHPDVTRYFMTIPEACRLVLQAASLGTAGETLVLDMGTPVPIVDIARRMMALTGQYCAIAYTGLRPGEKLAEELFTPAELQMVQVHDRIWHLPALPFSVKKLPLATAPPAVISQCYQELIATRTNDAQARVQARIESEPTHSSSQQRAHAGNPAPAADPKGVTTG